MKSFPTIAFAVVLSVFVAGMHLLLPVTEATSEPAATPKLGSVDRAPTLAQAGYLASEGRLPVPRMTGSHGVAGPPLPLADIVAAPSAAPQARTEASAKASVEADGYRGVSDLKRQADGTWQARAMRGTTEVLISISSGGSVSTQ